MQTLNNLKHKCYYGMHLSINDYYLNNLWGKSSKRLLPQIEKLKRTRSTTAVDSQHLKVKE